MRFMHGSSTSSAGAIMGKFMMTAATCARGERRSGPAIDANGIKDRCSRLA